nr:MAG TPA: hypothetical protein [Caudoviricetes sp.]
MNGKDLDGITAHLKLCSKVCYLVGCVFDCK